MKKPRNDLSAETVRSLYDYSPVTGEIKHRSRKSPRCRESGLAGTVAGGALSVQVNGVRYLAHRIIFLWMTGSWPNGVIDHIDGDRLNNKWVNLRDVSQATNSHNIHGVPRHKRYSSLIGAHWCNQIKKWKSSIKVLDKVHRLGVFDTDVDASRAYLKAKTEMHPGFDARNFSEPSCAR